MIIFHNFEHCSLSISMIINEIKTIGHKSKCRTFIASCNSNISHSLTCPKNWGTRPKRLKILKKMIISCNFEHSSLTIPTIKKKKKKKIGNATASRTLIISCNSSTDHSLLLSFHVILIYVALSPAQKLDEKTPNH